MKEYRKDNLLGILGGLGPRASAEFLKTIYDYNLSEPEQASPPVVMYSDPDFPDRSEALLTGSRDDLLEKLLRALHKLAGLNVSKIVICCFTMHYLLDKLPHTLRAQIVSLVELALAETAERRQRQLLICSEGARRMEVFQKHPEWETAGEYILWPDEEDQRLIHNLIYSLKKNCEVNLMIPVLERLLAKYRVDSFIAGCTEIHLLTKYLVNAGVGHQATHFIDPLFIIAERLSTDDFLSVPNHSQTPCISLVE